MMNGVTVLNVMPSDLSVYWVVVPVVMILGFATLIFSVREDVIPLIGAAILLLGAGTTLFILLFTPEHSSERYEVVISDDVSLNEFLERYKIIEQRGEIYTVIERKQNE